MRECESEKQKSTKSVKNKRSRRSMKEYENGLTPESKVEKEW